VARERAWARADGRVFHAAARRLWSCAQSRCAGMAARPLPPGRLGVPLGAGRAGRRVFHVKRSVARAGPGWRLAVSSASKLRGASGSRVAPGRVLRVDALWRERVQGGAVGHVVRVSCSVARTGPGWRLAVSSVDALWRERVQGGAWPCRPGQLLRGANGSRVAPGRASASMLCGASGSRVASWVMSSASTTPWRERSRVAPGRVVHVQLLRAFRRQAAGRGGRRGREVSGLAAVSDVPWNRMRRAGRVWANARSRVFHVKPSRACGVGGVAAPFTQLIRGAPGKAAGRRRSHAGPAGAGREGPERLRRARFHDRLQRGAASGRTPRPGVSRETVPDVRGRCVRGAVRWRGGCPSCAGDDARDAGAGWCFPMARMCRRPVWGRRIAGCFT
jgi:hypothetical protein